MRKERYDELYWCCLRLAMTIAEIYQLLVKLVKGEERREMFKLPLNMIILIAWKRKLITRISAGNTMQNTSNIYKSF